MEWWSNSLRQCKIDLKIYHAFAVQIKYVKIVNPIGINYMHSYLLYNFS